MATVGVKGLINYFNHNSKQMMPTFGTTHS